MESTSFEQLPGVHPSPNIQTDPDLYELENLALDPEGKIEAAMRAIAPWAGKVLLDLGAGTGFYVPRFHAEAQHVFAVEPHGPSRLRIHERVARLGLERASVLAGSAEFIPLRDASVDIVHARFAYFFAPFCGPGLPELERVIRPGGTAFIIDNDLRTGTFAAWLEKSRDPMDPDADDIELYWEKRGFSLTRIASKWQFQDRATLEAVVRLEFGEKLAPELLAEHEGLEVEYHYCLYHKRFGEGNQ